MENQLIYQAIDIDILIKQLNDLKSQGSTHVNILYNDIGYKIVCLNPINEN